MENLTISIAGDVNIHFNLSEPDDFLEDDESIDDFNEEVGDCENEDSPDCKDLSIIVNGLPDDIDEEAVQTVIETACRILDKLVDKAADSRKGGTDERI